MNGAADSNLWQPGVEACLDAAHPSGAQSLLTLSHCQGVYRGPQREPLQGVPQITVRSVTVTQGL